MADKALLKRVVFASLIGATVEWYDFFLYGVVAGIVFNHLYFPSHDILVSTMLAYTTFAVGFVTRPLGGVIFGHFGDRIGRKSMLILTLMIMGVATFLIGLVPTYDQIGIWAPIALLVLRILQGIGLGGEWGGAVLMTYEYAEPHKRGLYASLPQIGLSIGLCLASGVVALLSYSLTNEQFLAWGWRIAFVLSFVLVLVGLYIRLNIMETPEFSKLKESRKEVQVPFATMIKDYPKEILAGMGARYIDGVFFNIFGVYSIAYLTSQLKIPRTEALLGVCAAALIMCIFIPYFGRVSDRVGRTRTYAWGSLITGLSALPAFYIWMTYPDQPMAVWAALIIPFGILYASVYGPEASLFCDLFGPEVRYTGISFVYQFSGIFASGLTPIIATALMQYYGPQNGAWAVAWYAVFAGVVSALSAMWIARLARQRIQAGGTAPAALVA
ncbi:major facilitator family transporter [Afipia carboxidovorans OM5]|uniref:Shikimate transporter ShiA n=1 Tax=Afipia carboxidovorans (strain ATCC 49405 / DSM 1227 / KCTC 32145 / OM5) TaxID=504832 RepID=B6JGQ8_AFIC5|nr:MFS transporter [Afipia carboxidovorans]ACI93858.1 major facilitator family transporter [Afipia carboxidovorans OM5]AEI02466.1 shikimate transporter ShiA [Afipia carboxidovorans OM4]AEI06042.1 shikimate transporter ShiA [Afipia carboxidovorans OM5]